jgi:predicted small secreted protein
MKRLLTCLITVGAASLLLAACAEDDEGAGADDVESSGTVEPSTTAAADPAATSEFCDAVLAGDQLFSSSDQPDPAEWETIVESLRASTPQGVSDQIDFVISETDRMFQGAAEGTGPSEQYLQALDEVHEWMAGNCGWTTVEATARDFEFTGLPATVDAGDVVLALTNDGEEVHEMTVVRINDGVTDSVDDLLAMPEGEVSTKVTLAGSAFAMPGTTGFSAASLEPGRYLVICSIPEGTTPETLAAVQSGESEGGTSHAMLGMHAELAVA